MAFESKEHFRILFLDKGNHLIADEQHQTGTVDHTPVYPREVVKRGLELSATAVILVHNNPILSMCMAHTTIRTDAAGNRAPDKRKATHRIDGTVALVMGLAIVPTQAPAIDVRALIG